MQIVSRSLAVLLLATLVSSSLADEQYGPLAYPTSVGDGIDAGNHAYWPVRVRLPKHIEWSVELGQHPGMALPGPDGSVSIVHGDGNLHFLDPGTGKSRIVVEGTPDHPNRSSGIRGSDGTVYFGTFDVVRAVDANGQVRWSADVGAGIFRRPPLLSRDGKSLYVTGDTLSCAKLDAATGAVEWMRRDFKKQWSSMMMDHRDRFMITTGKSALHIESGPTKWSIKTISSRIMSVGDRLVNTTGKKSGCFHLEGKRKVVWSAEFPADGTGLALADDGDVRLALANGDLARIDENGGIVWRRQLSDAKLRSPVTTAGGETLVADAAGVLHLVDGDGRLLSSLDLGGVALSYRPAVAPDGSIYVTTADRLVKVSGPVRDDVPLPIAKSFMVVADDFVVDVWRNGELVPLAQRKLLGDVHGAITERITTDVMPGDWFVFHVVANRLRWKGASYFGAAARRFDKSIAFVSSTKSGNWFACDEPDEIPTFIAKRDVGVLIPATLPETPWEGAAKQWEGVIHREFPGEPVWGKKPSTWIKVLVPHE